MNKDNKQGWMLAVGALFLMGLAGWYWFGRGYAPISDKGYELALAMISACNRQDLDRVQSIVELARQAEEQQELPRYDARVLKQIGQMAVEGKWERASREARQLLDAQAKSAFRPIQLVHSEPFTSTRRSGCHGQPLARQRERHRPVMECNAGRVRQPVVWKWLHCHRRGAATCSVSTVV